MRRVFVAINLPNNIKEKLAAFRLKWPELPCRWTKKENLHITLEFLGYLTNEELVELCKKTEKIAADKKSFIVKLNKIRYGPIDKKPISSLSFPGSSRFWPRPEAAAPKMVWAIGEKIKEFNIVPHITLGRLRQWEFKRMELQERPEVSEDIDLSFEVSSIEVMESQFKRRGPEYTILESFQFSKDKF